jgi:hypothetical protein
VLQPRAASDPRHDALRLRLHVRQEPDAPALGACRGVVPGGACLAAPRPHGIVLGRKVRVVTPDVVYPLPGRLGELQRRESRGAAADVCPALSAVRSVVGPAISPEQQRLMVPVERQVASVHMLHGQRRPGTAVIEGVGARHRRAVQLQEVAGVPEVQIDTGAR